MTKKQKRALAQIIVSSVLLVILQLLGAEFFDRIFGAAGRWVRLAAYLADYWIIGGDILKKAWKGLKNKQPFDECLLMAIATIGALALAIYENGDYLEAIAVMLFYQIGELFQSYAVGKSRQNISELMDMWRITAFWKRWTRTRWRWAPSSWCSPARRCPLTASWKRAAPP